MYLWLVRCEKEDEQSLETTERRRKKNNKTKTKAAEAEVNVRFSPTTLSLTLTLTFSHSKKEGAGHSTWERKFELTLWCSPNLLSTVAFKKEILVVLESQMWNVSWWFLSTTLFNLNKNVLKSWMPMLNYSWTHLVLPFYKL